ncbi:MAG TPA: AarF/UbiB family protein [Thermoanaerobaculia bacterium]|nr:AarF/UbiB family protein [Thermoanaerobaculia bacterium]
MSTVLTLRTALRGAARARDVVSVLARYGWADLAAEWGLPRSLRPVREEVVAAEGEDEDAGLPNPRSLRRAFEELGPTFVKLGQVLSTRSDLLEEAYTRELRLLQEQVAPVPFEEIEEVIDDALGERRAELFLSIDEQPLAAGSIAQIHRARLRDGSEVVVKVLRPGIREVIAGDIEVMTLIAGFAERRAEQLGFSPLELVREFTRSIYREIDLLHEGQATERFRKAFADDPRVVFPRVTWEAATSQLLTLEFLPGSTLARLEPEDIEPELRQRLLETGTDVVFRQCLELGFFHADPHPGNLMVLDDGRLGFVDCGMSGQVDSRTAGQLADLVSGLVQGDSELVLDAALRITDGDVTLQTDRRLRRTVSDFLLDVEGTDLEHLEVGKLLRRFFDTLREHRLRCPGDLLMLIKALTTIEGVATWLDPSFDVVASLRPHVERLIGHRYAPEEVWRRVQHAVQAYSRLLADLPRDVRMLSQRLRSNRLSMGIEHRGLDRLTETIEHASRNVAFALMIAATIVGSAILVMADVGTGTAGLLTQVAIAAAVVAAVLGLLLALTHYRGRRTRP